MQVNGHFLPLEYSCCNLLQNCKDTLFTPAFGLFGAAFLRNAAKPLFFLLPFLFQCLTRTEKACKMFRYSPRHGNGRAQVFITCVSFTISSPLRRRLMWRDVVCYLLGIFPPTLTARLSFICVREHIPDFWRLPFFRHHFPEMALQKYNLIWYAPNKKPKKFVLLTIYNK